MTTLIRFRFYSFAVEFDFVFNLIHFQVKMTEPVIGSLRSGAHIQVYLQFTSVPVGGI
jgi:hypothetical protein